MEANRIRAAIREFLDLVGNGIRSVSENEARLPHLLDRLALAQNSAQSELDESVHPEPPHRDKEALRDLVTRRFPNYGYYNTAETITEAIGESGCTIGDGIDDLVDIYTELLDVEWRWVHTSESDALWHFRFGFRCHWGTHLRSLQLYLHALRADAESPSRL